MFAASVADFIICCLTARGSITFSLCISVTTVLITSIPVHFEPLLCLALSVVMVSIGSIPAFTANARGMVSKASANFRTANWALPSILPDHCRNSLATKASGAPPPATTTGFSKTSFTTINAS